MKKADTTVLFDAFWKKKWFNKEIWNLCREFKAAASLEIKVSSVLQASKISFVVFSGN